ncbi:CAP domain-containing protein [Cohnella hongkongensis]|uniref:CAP domain-containing protein n=1 Tax=Cohnella hongkongensis TaxID=178337 RepID=A0ABV9F6B6_9BACL
MKKFKAIGLKKTLMLGTLALAISVPAGAGAVSAAPAGQIVTPDQLTQIASRFGIDLHSLLQQIGQRQTPVYNPPSSSGGADNGQVAKPSKPSRPALPSAPGAGSNGSSGNTGSGNTGNAGAEAADSAFATQVITLVNQERAKAGLKPLAATNATLTKMALDKAKDMYHNGYFDHNSPTYGSPFDMMKKYGINYRYAGENIAKGQRTPQEVMNAWMNSPGHRANILSANFTTIGVAYYNGVWVQEFIS